MKKENSKLILKSMRIWLLFVPIAILNGGFRELVTTPLVGESVAHPLSCIILCALVFIVSLWLIPRIGNGGNRRTYIITGIIWLLLTVLFEFGMGLVTGASFTEMLKAYDITSGNGWLAVVIFIGITPCTVAAIKGLTGKNHSKSWFRQ